MDVVFGPMTYEDSLAERVRVHGEKFLLPEGINAYLLDCFTNYLKELKILQILEIEHTPAIRVRKLDEEPFIELIAKLDYDMREIIVHCADNWDRSESKHYVRKVMENVDKVLQMVQCNVVRLNNPVWECDRVQAMTSLLLDLDVKFAEVNSRWEKYTAVIHMHEMFENIVKTGSIDRYLFIQQFPSSLDVDEEDKMRYIKFNADKFREYAFAYYKEKQEAPENRDTRIINLKKLVIEQCLSSV